MRLRPLLQGGVVALALAGCGRVDEGAATTAHCGSPVASPDAMIPEVVRPRPARGFLHEDPALGGCLSRVSDHEALGDEAAQAAPGRQAFDPSGTRVLLASGAVLDTERFAPVAELPHAPGVWAPDAPGTAYFVDASSLVAFDVDSGSQHEVASFPEYSKLDTSAGLRNPSAHGRSIALVGARAADGVYEIFVWDFAKREKSAVVVGPVDAVLRATAPRWAAVSPSGRWVVVGWPDAGSAYEHGVEVYAADMSFHAHRSDSTLAADLAMDDDGVEWLVDVRSGGSGLSLVKSALDDGRTTSLLALDWFENARIACRAVHTDACAVSTQGDLGGSWHPFQDEIFTVALGSRADAPVVERLLHHESAPEFVAAQPEESCGLSPEAVLPNPVLARDGRQVLFTSNWNAHCFGELYLAVR